MPPTSTPRTAVHTSDLSPEDFALSAGKIVSRTGLAGPFQLLSGTIDDYENQSQKPELVWFGGTEEDPFCIWISYPNGSYLKIKWPTPSELGFCQSVVDCILADLERGAGAPDKYRIPEMVGPTWRIVTVVYGDADTEVSFSADTGTDLVSLIAALNDSANLPEDWYWEILTGALALCVPHETGVTKVILDGGTEVDFTVPTVIGTPESRLGSGITITPSITGNGAAVGSAHDTEAEVEAQFALMQNVTVRWTDADGDERVSYKDSVNGWYHPVEKFLSSLAGAEMYSYTPITANYVEETIAATIDVSDFGVPANARFVDVFLYLGIEGTSVGVTSISNASVGGKVAGFHTFEMVHFTDEEQRQYHTANFRIPLNNSGELTIGFESLKAEDHQIELSLSLRGWSR